MMSHSARSSSSQAGRGAAAAAASASQPSRAHSTAAAAASASRDSQTQGPSLTPPHVAPLPTPPMPEGLQSWMREQFAATFQQQLLSIDSQTKQQAVAD
jgi:hypothetical protein